MTWVLVALLGYFFNAVSALFDKFLLSDRIGAPAVYAFFVSLFSLFALFFIPFGFRLGEFWNSGLLIFSGMLFIYGLVAFYYAVKNHEVSRVAPLLGTVVSVVGFGAAFLPGNIGGNTLSMWSVLALVFLILGGLLISFDLPLRSGETISKLVLIAGLFIGVSALLLKYGYGQTNFVSGVVWQRFGMFLGGFSLLLVPLFRLQIFDQLTHFSQKPGRAGSTGLFFVLNKVCAGVAAFLISYATFHGPVSFVQALAGMQYVFILGLAVPLAFRYPTVYREKLSLWDWLQKGAAIILIGLGLWLMTTQGIKILL